jgi:two-component system response regulator QseB
MRILVVEDDEVLRDGLSAGLGLHGFTVDAVADWTQAREAGAVGHFDAAVVDIMLPDGNGLSLIAALRSAQGALPVLLLTARDAVDDRVRGLDAGADDYLCKPFDLDELAARLRALLRRGGGGGPQGNGAAEGDETLRLDPRRLEAIRHGETVALTRREFAILRALMEHPGAILSKGQLEERLYGFNECVGSNAIEVHVHHLRGKLGQGVIETVRGVGYRLGEHPS